MAIEHLYTILCEYLIQASDGKISAVGMFHNIQTPKLPATRDSMGVVVAFRGDEGDAYDIALEGPEGLHRPIYDGIVTSSAVRHEHEQATNVFAAVMHPAVFDKEGVYRVVLRSGTHEVHTYTFGVFQGAGAREEQRDG